MTNRCWPLLTAARRQCPFVTFFGRRREGLGATLRSHDVHVALVSQNAAIEGDIRPRAEAESLAENGFSVTLIAGTRAPHEARRAIADGVALATFLMPEPANGVTGQVRELGTSFVRLARTLMRVSRHKPIDILHASNPPDNVWMLLWLLRLRQGFAPKFVFDQHDVAPALLAEKYGDRGKMALLAYLTKFLERRSFSSAALVVFANAEYERRAMARGLLESDAVIVPNGWRLAEGLQDLKWRGEAAKAIAYIGTTNEQDCIVHFVEAIAHLPSAHETRVIVAGDGSALSDAKHRAKQLGIADSFEWLGWVNDRFTLGSIVRSVDVCVAPEVESEFNRLASFVKLVEYMSAGAAVVAHRLPQTEAVCGETIRYADDMTAEALGSAITDVLADTALAARIGGEARARFDRELWWGNVGAPRLVNAYRRLASKCELRRVPG